jgi:hypothetical protein
MQGKIVFKGCMNTLLSSKQEKALFLGARMSGE